MKTAILIISILFFTLNVSTAQPRPEDKPYSNPLLIYGSSFGNFFKALYKTGDFDTMMKFTSQRSIDAYGYKNILDYYKTTDFGYEMTLRSRTIKNGIYTLNYVANILGTQKVVRLDVVVENDSSKIVLDNIMFNLGISYYSIVELGMVKEPIYDVYGNRMK